MTAKGLKSKNAYRAYVKAYKLTKSGKKKYLKNSFSVHAVTAGSSRIFTNPKKITVNKKKVSLKAGKKFKIKAKTVRLEKKKKLLSASHGAPLRYRSDNKKVATVDKNGKIRAVSAGKCNIYVIAINGISRKITVTVK